MEPTQSLDTWRAAAGSFTHAGHRIAYWTGGDGPSLLLVHGFPTASWDWHRVWPALATRFRLVALDMLGFGFSDKPRRHAYSILEQADLQEALLARLGVARAHVLAHDYGDSVAQELLARHLERRASGAPGLALESVVFLNGGLFPEAHRPRLGQKLLAGPLGPLLSRVVGRGAFARGLAEVFGPRTQPSAADQRDFWMLVSHAGGQRIGHELIAYMQERRDRRERWVGALVASDVPLRLVDGALDPVSGAHLAERYRELVPSPDVVLLPDVGHYPQLEAPEAVLRAFFAFHARLGAGGR
jgi:pimeloyl-ACP methyl ester carboxylesterase